MSRGDKSKQITCNAIDACTQDQIIDIFEESFGYLSFIEKFVKRVQSSPIDYNTDTIAASDKPLIVLDIDNTILFVRFFSDEICVNDKIIYYHNGMDETHGIVRAVWYRLKLHLSDDDLIDEYGTDMIEYDHCHTGTNRLRKKKQFEYPYKINEKTNEIIDSRTTFINQLAVIGCEIEYKVSGFDDYFYKFISFEEDSIEIENFLPALQRKGYKDAAFVHDGFIVRIRPGVEDFLDSLEQHWTIVFFTAANRTIYEGLMQQLHTHLCVMMGRDEELDKPLWQKIFFRDDCTYDFDERGKIYHHKDLTKYNRDLSKLLIVDNSSLSYKSLEPNAILIKDYFGKSTVDSELDIVLELTDRIIDIALEHENDDIFVDFRYILTGMVTDENGFEKYNDLNGYDRRNPNDILLSTQRFLHDLKENLIGRGKLPTTLVFGEAKTVMETSQKTVTNANVVSEGDSGNVSDIVEKEVNTAAHAQNDSLQSLQSSITSEIKESESSATPRGNYTPGVQDSFKKVNAESDNKEVETPVSEEKTGDNYWMDAYKGNDLNKYKRDSHTYNISINLADIPNIASMQMTDDKSPLGIIMQMEDNMGREMDMNETQMRNYTEMRDEFGDLESVSSDNNGGIGSKMDETDEEDLDQSREESESDWDDIEEEEQIEVKEEETPMVMAPPKRRRETDTGAKAVKAPLLSAPMGPKPNRRFSTMKPRPKHEKIESGMSTMFLKLHRHWNGPSNIKDIKRMKMRRDRSSSGRNILTLMNEGSKKIKHAMHRRKQRKEIRKRKAKEMKQKQSEAKKNGNLAAFNDLYYEQRRRRRGRRSYDSDIMSILECNGYYKPKEKMHINNKYFSVGID